MSKDLSPVLPHIEYDRGFSGRKNPAFWDLTSARDETANWSDDMASMIAESTRQHFIDRYNRALAVKAVAPALTHLDAQYIDVGCAAGYLLEEARASFPQAAIFGSDFSTSSLRQCHENFPDVPLFRLDITQIQLDAELFDAVTCLNVLEHIENDEKALHELARILKPEGRLFISVPAGPHLYDFNDEAHFHVRRYTRTDLENKLERAGFNIVALNYFGFFIYPAFYLQKRFNQILFSKESHAQKHARAERQATDSGRLYFMEWLCRLEERVGARVHFPFGIRLYATVMKKNPVG